MIVLSFNVRGVGGKRNLLSLHRLFDGFKPNIVFSQGTMVLGERDRKLFSKLLINWEICLVDACGQSTGLLMA